MKKKITIIFMLLLTVFMFNGKNVYADDPVTWPKSFTSDNYDYSIEGIVLKVYKIDENKTTTTTDPDDDSTIETNEDYLAFIHGNPTSTITLNPSEFTIDPIVREVMLKDVKTTLIDINLNITKEKMEELLVDEIESVTDTVSFKVELVLNYKMTRYPTKYTHFQGVNLYRAAINIFDSLGTGNQLSYDGTVDMSGTISQVINYAEIQKNDDPEQKLTFLTELNENNGLATFIFNPLMLSEEEMSIYSSENEEPDPSKYELVLFHSVDNIQYLIDNLNKVEETTQETAQDTVGQTIKDLEVQVPNTAKGVSIAWIMIGVITLFAGIIIISYSLKMKELKRLKQQKTI